MRRVRYLTAEPPRLAEYRCLWPSEDLRPGHEAGAVWDGFRSYPGAYDELLHQLAEAQRGLCLYCEQRVVDDDGRPVSNDYQVEHVLPKSGDPGRALDWKNLALACAGGTYAHPSDGTRSRSGRDSDSCGQRKDALPLPVGGDPRAIPMCPSPVSVGLDGRLAPHPSGCGAAGIAVNDITTMIELLNLNCERLRKARQDAADFTRSWFVLVMEGLVSSHLSDEERLLTVELLVAGRLQPDRNGYLRRFWSSERSALAPVSEVWLQANASKVD